MVLFRAGSGRCCCWDTWSIAGGCCQVEAQWGAVLAERGRLAREIHDTLAQGFVGISVQLELVARLLAGSREAARSQQLDQARALVRASLAEARTSIWDLRSAGCGARRTCPRA